MQFCADSTANCSVIQTAKGPVPNQTKKSLLFLYKFNKIYDIFPITSTCPIPIEKQSIKSPHPQKQFKQHKQQNLHPLLQFSISILCFHFQQNCEFPFYCSVPEYWLNFQRKSFSWHIYHEFRTDMCMNTDNKLQNKLSEKVGENSQVHFLLFMKKSQEQFFLCTEMSFRHVERLQTV